MFAATLLGIAVLIAEFTSKMKTVKGIITCSTMTPHCLGGPALPEYITKSMGVALCMQDGSSDVFRHNIVSVWNTAVGGVCLMLMSAIMAVFAWRIRQAKQLNKTWYVYKGALMFTAVAVCSLVAPQWFCCASHAVYHVSLSFITVHCRSLTNGHNRGHKHLLR